MSQKIDIPPTTPEQDEYLRGIMERSGQYDRSRVVGGPKPATTTPTEDDAGREFVPYGPTERAKMLRVYLSGARDILRGPGKLNAEKLAKEIQRQLDTDDGRARAQPPQPSGDVKELVERLERAGNDAVKDESCIVSGKLLYDAATALRAANSRLAATAQERDSLVFCVMRGSHREARDMARPRFVELNPDERNQAERLSKDADLLARAEAAEARVAELEKALRAQDEANELAQDRSGAAGGYERWQKAEDHATALRRAALSTEAGGE